MKLHEYQRKAIAFMHEQRQAILSIDMGLGKTASVLHFLQALHPQSVIIVAPKRVAETVWQQEAEKWGLDIAKKMVVIAGTPKKRQALWTDSAHPYKVVGRDNLGDIAKFFGNLFVDVLVIDELTTFKNVSSGRSRFLQNISFKRAIGLTGTLLANGAIDIYGQAAALALSKRLGKSFYSWRGEHFYDAAAHSGLNFPIWRCRTKLADLLRPIRENVFTLSAADYLEIPSVTEKVTTFDLSAAEREAYDGLECFLGAEIGGEVFAIKEGAKFQKLQTLCNGFAYNANGRPLRCNQSQKLELVADFCEQCYNEGEQVLLFYSYREERKWLEEMLAAKKVKFDGVDKRGFFERWKNCESGVLLAHPASAGHGLNLQGGGHIVVWSSVTYNYEFFAQANARLARQGQTKAVQIYYFVANNTLEHRQQQALSRKAAEQQLFVNLTKTTDEDI